MPLSERVRIELFIPDLPDPIYSRLLEELGDELTYAFGGATVTPTQGKYNALRALEQRRREDDLKLKALRIQIKAGIDAIKRGDFAKIEETDLEEYLERLTAPRQRGR